jgi:hypothetical protein
MRRPRGNSGVPQEPRRSGVAGLYVVPRLEELVADPERVSSEKRSSLPCRTLKGARGDGR